MAQPKNAMFLVLAQLAIVKLPPAISFTIEEIIEHCGDVGAKVIEDKPTSALATWRTVVSMAARRGLLVRCPEKRKQPVYGKMREITCYTRTDLNHVIAPPKLLLEAHKLMSERTNEAQAA